MESLVHLQLDIQSRINRALINYKKSPKERITKEYLEGRLEALDKLWSEFTKGHTSLTVKHRMEDLKALNYNKDDRYDETEEVYLDLKCELRLKLAQCNSQISDKLNVSGDNSTLAQNVVRLPKIDIPKFSGDYSEWASFEDLFSSLIITNNALSNVQKLHYLKTSLVGEAEQLLKHIPIQDCNFQRCWELLTNRYNNKRYISHQVLRRFLSQRNLAVESAQGLKELVDTTNDCLSTLNSIGVDTTTWDILIIHILTLKLDMETRRQWEFHVATFTNDLPTYKEFEEFLTQRFRANEFLNTKVTTTNRNTRCGKTLHVATLICPYCTEGHKLSFCKKFLKMPLEERRKFVLENNVCFVCMGNNHSAKDCHSNVKCRICKRNHHSLLHPSGKNTDDSAEKKQHVVTAPKDAASQSSNLVSCFSTDKGPREVLLATAVIKAVSKNGQVFDVRALLDQGSQSSFVTESTVQYLGLKKSHCNIQVTGLSGNKALLSKAKVTIEIRSRTNDSVGIIVNAYVIKNITTHLPAKRISKGSWPEIDNLALADPDYHTPNKIDLLLGADIYAQILKKGLRRGPPGTPVAQATSLGWILSGVVDTDFKHDIHRVSVHFCAEQDNDDLLKKFWEIESDIPQPKEKMFTEEEILCEQYFTETTRRNEEGRYIVRLPYKNGLPEVTGSKEIAERRLRSLEIRLEKDKPLKSQYDSVIKEYVSLGHMEVVPLKEIENKNAIYLPHHAVVREDKESTKVRVVFDASCKGKNGLSLNDQLLVGPSLQPELRHTIMQWRSWPICLSADIVKMYRQVKIDQQDADCQRILWRESKGSEIKSYRHTRVTFGTASAPYLAVKTLQQVALDHGRKYPLAAERVLKHFYVDDLMTGAQSIEEGKIVFEEMNNLLSKAGFELQKWSSNSNELLESIKKGKEGEELKTEIKLKEDNIMKTLGLTWHRSDDSFQYSVKLPELHAPVTKRKIISDISRLFDPLGWVAPVVVIAKMTIQKLWLSGIGWDEEISKDMLKEWSTYREQLLRLADFSVPRWLGVKQGDKQVDLHGFCDASKMAYAAVVYVRVVDAEGNIHVTLLTAKTKVAPIKTISIPRLELCGAVLLGKLLAEVACVLNLPKTHIHAWTDSEIVLSWLNSHPSRWKPFIANRVSEILCTTEPHQWNHVSSNHNPADCASRGLYPAEMVKLAMWTDGPKFLYNPEITVNKTVIKDTTLEQTRVHNVTSVEENNFIWDKYSSLNKLIRVVALCRRVLDWRKPKHERKGNKYLTAEELNLSMETCIRQCQRQYFTEEISSLKSKGVVAKKSSLHSLTPYLDAANIVRVGGRLGKSNVDMNQKHPIIMPRKSSITELIVAEAHQRTLHGGAQLMLNYLGTKYYIVGAKSIVKAHVRKCVTCIRYSASTQHQLMGQLPSVRVTPSKPFRNTGVDYAGPISIRTSKGRGHHAYKGYICLFVCMVTKAVHIEAVSDLTTQGFLAAFRRLVARRGHCSDMWSDNGTNFQGASKELRMLFDAEKGQIGKDIAESLANNGTTWHYIPPHAPNFGGLWEAGIKSCKQHLKRIIGNSTLTYEELATLLCQIEACLNSRPLYRLSDSNNIDALTPGHFLVGEPLINVPDLNFQATNISNLKRFQLVQRMMQSFWRRWSSEYLCTLYQRHKWTHQVVEPGVGDIVLIKEDDLPPARWLMGRIIEKHIGQDGLTRVVTLKTKASTIKGPTSKLCILPSAK